MLNTGELHLMAPLETVQSNSEAVGGHAMHCWSEIPLRSQL